LPGWPGGVMNNKRKYERFPISVEVRVEHPDLGVFILNTRDMSDGGVFLQFGGNPRRPVVGAEVSLQLAQLPDGSQPPTVRGHVARVSEDGFAVAFTIPEN
jgi:hypothetical protein